MQTLLSKRLINDSEVLCITLKYDLFMAAIHPVKHRNSDLPHSGCRKRLE